MSRPKFRFTKRQLAQPILFEKEEFGLFRGLLSTFCILAIVASIVGLWLINK